MRQIVHTILITNTQAWRDKIWGNFTKFQNIDTTDLGFRNGTKVSFQFSFLFLLQNQTFVTNCDVYYKMHCSHLL